MFSLHIINTSLKAFVATYQCGSSGEGGSLRCRIVKRASRRTNWGMRCVAPLWVRGPANPAVSRAFLESFARVSELVSWLRAWGMFVLISCQHAGTRPLRAQWSAPANEKEKIKARRWRRAQANREYSESETCSENYWINSKGASEWCLLNMSLNTPWSCDKHVFPYVALWFR